MQQLKRIHCNHIKHKQSRASAWRLSQALHLSQWLASLAHITTVTIDRSLVIVLTLVITASLLLAPTWRAAAANVSAAVDDYRADVGPDPVLPEPDTALLPTIHTAKAIGWQGDAMPIAAAGLTVTAFAIDLAHPRWLYVLPNGDVLVAETNGPVRPDDRKGITGWVAKKTMERAGAEAPSANRIILLRDADHDGHAETRSVFLENLNAPFGMALIGDTLYVANTDALLSFHYTANMLHIADAGTTVIKLPAGSINHHWTKNILPSSDGTHLFITVGSNSNAAENGLSVEQGRATILQLNLASHRVKPYATGLRNPNGLALNPESGVLWTVANERDELGDHLVPDYLTSIKENGFYGWPFSYYGQHVDTRVKPANAQLVATAIAPDYALGSHVAALGLCFYQASLLPAHYKNGAFIGLHGSWNRKVLTGYKVVFIPFHDGRPAGLPEDVLSGFLNEAGAAQGRPVGVTVDQQGALLVADDVGNRVWRVTPGQQQ